MNAYRKPLVQTQALRNAKLFVVYGLSRSLKGYAKDVIDGIAEMSPNVGIVAVHPEVDEIGSYKAVRSAVELGKIDDCLALIVLDSKRAMTALRDVVQTDVKNVWLVMNAHTPETKKFAEDNRLCVLTGCPLLFVNNPRGFHRLHWYIARLFGRI